MHPYSQTVKDWMIVVLISVLVGIDVVILVIVTAVPELRTTAILKQSTEFPQTVTGVCLLSTLASSIKCSFPSFL